MQELTEIKINVGEITDVRFTEYGKVYDVNIEGSPVQVNTRYYDTTSSFMSNEFGGAAKYATGKSITLISDDERLLAIRSTGRTMTFVPDLVGKDGEEVRFLDNTNYIMNKYGLTPEEFLEVVKDLMETQKLKKQMGE